MYLRIFLLMIGLMLLGCSSKNEKNQDQKTQEVFTQEDNYYDYQYYEDPVDDPLTNFSTPYNRPVYQEPEAYYEEVQMMQDFSEDDKEETESEEVKEVERKGARGYLYDGAPPPKSKDWFFDDY